MIVDGGSSYYLVAGILSLVSTVLVNRRDGRVAWVYGGLVALTIVWAVYDAGLFFWPLPPRLDAIVVLGLPLLFAGVGVPLPATTRRAGGYGIASLGLVGSVLIGEASPCYDRGTTDPLRRYT